MKFMLLLILVLGLLSCRKEKNTADFGLQDVELAFGFENEGGVVDNFLVEQSLNGVDFIIVEHIREKRPDEQYTVILTVNEGHPYFFRIVARKGIQRIKISDVRKI